MSWYEVTPDGPPVRGFLSHFELATTRWSEAADQAQSLQRQFKAIIDGQNLANFQGQAAHAFAEIIRETQLVLDDVPTVFRTISSILEHHEARLRDLYLASDRALARAKTAKAEKAAAAANAASCQARCEAIERQIYQLSFSPPETTGARIALLEDQVLSERARLHKHQTSETNWQSCLSTELDGWRSLRSDEDDLNRHTADRLANVDLKGLANPGWFDKVVDFVGGVGGDLLKFAEALFIDKDLGQALWHLRDAIDSILMVLDVVVIALVVIAAIGVSILTGGAATPILLVALKVGLVLSAVKLSTSAALVISQTENKVTGEKLGLMDVAVDGLDLALRVSGLSAMNKASALLHAGKPAAAFRVLAADNHVIMKNFGQLSMKRTLKQVPVQAVEFFLGSGPGLVRDHIQPSGAGGTHDVMSILYGAPASDPRIQVINEEIGRLQSTNRGMTDPVQTIVGPTY